MIAAENFKDYITDFEKKLGLVVPDDITTTQYIKGYLSYLLQHKKYYLNIYADVLHKLLQHSTLDKTEIVLVDFGAGNGLLGIFAKFCGFKKVFLNDIDEKFIVASEKLAARLGVKMDGYIPGDITATGKYFKNKIPDAVIGTDVIEHIYDLKIFFTGLQQMNPSMVTVFTTASNPANYLKVKQLKKLQLKDELLGGLPGDNIFFGNSSSEPFLNTRQLIIKTNSKDLPTAMVFDLAIATRGMNKADIISALEQYKISGKLPVPPAGNNTCDPLNGCWTERILSLKDYQNIYTAAGFEVMFYNGFYNDYEEGLKSYLKKILNTSITIFGNKIAPYIIIAGRRNT